ncbi:MAG: molybdopterin-guanine dinucleotide biosynthesis protein B [Anaerolineae bacterium]|nr:molybdopterin-guanine dinucleotide biosynthesis protein B [Gemmatimonadaceae bacterium]
MPRPPMLAIIGKKNSGKTTLVVALVAELGGRGHRVMTIKHGSHTFNIDPSTTDTYRHYHEGSADKVAMVAPDKFALIERLNTEPSPEEVAEKHMRDADIVVCEGFKKSTLPKIEVFRTRVHATALFTDNPHRTAQYIAIVTDIDAELPVTVPVIRFSDGEWLSRLADLVERKIMGR